MHNLIISWARVRHEQGLIRKTMGACADVLTKKQLGHLLARQGVALDLEGGEVSQHCPMSAPTCTK